MSGRLVLFSRSQSLADHERRPGDQFVPLSEAARDDLARQDPSASLAELPAYGALQQDALTDAFETATAILAVLEGDPAWRKLLTYRGYDLRAMAVKNLFFVLEDVSRVHRLAAEAAARYPDHAAILLDGDGDVARAVRAALPDVAWRGQGGGRGRFAAWFRPAARTWIARRARPVARAWIARRARPAARTWIAWRARPVARTWIARRARPAARYVRDRVQVWRAERPAPRGDRPVICFFDAPHRARLMARTLALLAPDHPIHGAWWGEGAAAWPDDLPVQPGAVYPWYAYTRRGAAWRVARHVLGSRARTSHAAFGLDAIAWLPPGLLWTLRYADMQRYANMIEAFEGLAEAQHPALWFVLEDLLAFGKAAAAVGARHGVPTIDVQHGILGAYPYRTGIDVPGVFAAFGEADRAVLIARGADPARVIVTGPVRYDDLRALHVDRAGMRRAAGLDPARPVVLFASQPAQRLVTEGGKRAALRALAAAAMETGAQVVIKTHPLEDVPALRRIMAEVGLDAPVVEGQLYEWLLACDAMATISSTVVYEAAVAERPALLLEWSGNSDVAGYVAAGIGLRPDAPGETPAALHALLHDEAVRAAMLERQRTFTGHHLAGADGHASKRLAALARRLMGEGA